MAAPAPEAFGDAKLAREELLPHGLAGPRLDERGLYALWAVAACVPMSMSMAGGLLGLVRPATLATFAGGLGAALLLAMLLGRTTLRLGVGSVPQARATFGPRGASLVLFWRASAGVFVAAAYLAAHGEWILRLAHATRLYLSPLVARDIPRAFEPASSMVLLIFIIVLAMRAARKDGLALARHLEKTLLFSALLAVALVVLVLLRAPASLSQSPPAPRALGLAGLAQALLWSVPAILGVNDWWRYRRGRTLVCEGARGALGMAALLPLFLLTALVVAERALMTSGVDHGHLIPNAVAACGLLAAALALAVTIALAVATVALIGIFGPSLALMGAWPYPARWRTSTRVMGVAILAAAVFFWLSPWLARSVAEALSAALLAVVGVMAADELRRGGDAYIEELYLARSFYGPCAGFSPPALLALLSPFAARPMLARHLPEDPTGLFWLASIFFVAAASHLVFTALIRLFVKARGCVVEIEGERKR